MKLEDKTCAVTGGSRGIGRAIAEEFGEQGANVIVNYRSYDVTETINEGPGSAIPVQADVAEMDDVQRMYEAVEEAYGGVDVLVNNAGMTRDKKFENMDREDWERVIEVNLGGVFNCTNAFFDDLQEANEGRLINISSVVGQQGNYGQLCHHEVRPVRLHPHYRAGDGELWVDGQLRRTGVRRDGHAGVGPGPREGEDPRPHPAVAVRYPGRRGGYRELRRQRGLIVHDRPDTGRQRGDGVVR